MTMLEFFTMIIFSVYFYSSIDEFFDMIENYKFNKFVDEYAKR